MINGVRSNVQAFRDKLGRQVLSELFEHLQLSRRKLARYSLRLRAGLRNIDINHDFPP